MLRKLAFLLVLMTTLPMAAHAVTTESYGPRVGLSIDPDQLVLGGQMTIGEVAPSLNFVPNIELGVGDHVTLVALNADMHYKLTLHDTDWKPYVGFGLGINFASVDRPAPFDDDSDTEIGGNFILGADVPTKSGSLFFSELKLGLGDIPSLKVLVGWNFRSGR